MLVPNVNSPDAPKVKLISNKLIIETSINSKFNYALSKPDGSVLQKGIFEEEVELNIEALEATNCMQLDLFDGNQHFIYNFVVPKSDSKDRKSTRLNSSHVRI